MNVAKLVAAFVAGRPLTWAFHALLLAASVALILTVLLLRQAAETRLDRDLADVDLVVGAKGSPLQLAMSAVLHVDAPTGNIPLEVAERLARDPLVATAAPVSLGDSVQGVRIVGSDRRYPALYAASVAEGRWWGAPMEAVLGASAARALGLGVGDRFQGEHGLAGGERHGPPYVVVGVLRPTGAVLDRLVLTDLDSVWALHETEADHVGHGGEEHARDVTAVLVRYQSPLGAVVLPRRVGETPDLIAASPAREAARLNELAGIGADALTRVGSAFLVLSGIGFLIALASAVLARRRDLAVLRALGASQVRIVGIVMAEGAVLALAGGIAGLVLGRLGAAYVGSRASGYDLPIPAFGFLDLTLLGAALALGLLAALGPALFAARADVVGPLTGDRA
jgi:putative ABC transport system permease protein